MPAARKSAGKKRPRCFRRILLALAALLILWMLVSAQVVSLSSVTLPLRDLPLAFSGTKVLYLTDLHINSLNSPEKVSRMIGEIARLEPDLILFGGDYTNFYPLMRVSAAFLGRESPRTVEAEMRASFFQQLASVEPPLGKYGVAGESDNLLDRNGGGSLSSVMALGGVTLLRDQKALVEKDGARLVIIGVDDWTTGMQDTRTPASLVSASDCVILLSHNPEAVPALNNQPASDGAWIDLALTGHTHGGGICLFGRELFNPLAGDERYAAGWHRENGAKVLISAGIGNMLLPLRLNAPPQAHLITLTRGNGG